MLKLHCLENTELSEYCLNILEKHGITLIRQFVAEKPEKLVKVLNLNIDKVNEIKEEFRRLYGPKPYTVEFFETAVQRKEIYNTQIASLDKMMMPLEMFGNYSFWEICGPTAVGKTQLAFTLLLNFVMNQVKHALYIDTKLDFSANRFKNMLEARKIEPDLYAGIMSYIKVERVLSPQKVVEMLEEFQRQLQRGSDDVQSIKMIVIDSLPAAWFLLKADSNRLASKWLLSRLSQIINLLVRRHNIAVICVNLSIMASSEKSETNANVNDTSYSESSIKDIIEDDDAPVDGGNLSALPPVYRPALGHFWLSKPHVRLSLEFPDKLDASYEENPSLRVIKLINTRFCPSDRRCSVRLEAGGFV